MRRTAKTNSIEGRINGNGRIFTAALVSFLVLNLILMYISEANYDRFVQRIEALSSLKPVIYEQIADEAWEVIAGRKSLGDCQAGQMIDDVNARLTSMSDGENDTEVLVILRAMDTMRSYVRKIETNMASGVRVAESEALLNDLRDVGSLVRDMLEDYIAKQISREADKNQQARIVFIACCAGEVLLWSVFHFYSRRATRNLADYTGSQIGQLETFAGQLADGQLDARAPAMQTEELKPLTESLNVMAERLNGVIAQSKREQENLKKAELRLLQAQINPHFLYNTLDAIVWQAEANNSAEVISITRALSDFFRISLSSGKEWITIEQERKHLEGYLSIQKVRYRDILNYTIEIDDGMKNEIVLKLLLQPLVENALYHGIKPKRGGGSILVRGEKAGNELLFSVHDTGNGIPEERLREIREALRDDNTQITNEQIGGSGSGSGFGLKNVDTRIRLYYGKSEGITIESGEHGTTVSFRLPAGMKGEEDAESLCGGR